MPRSTLDFPKGVYDTMQALKEKTESASITEVVRRAIRIYDFLVEAKTRGAVFKVIESDGKEVGIEFLL